MDNKIFLHSNGALSNGALCSQQSPRTLMLLASVYYLPLEGSISERFVSRLYHTCNSPFAKALGEPRSVVERAEAVSQQFLTGAIVGRSKRCATAAPESHRKRRTDETAFKRVSGTKDP